jgi:hypothetical protein
MRIITVALLPSLLLASCANDPWSGPHTSSNYYGSLHGNAQREIFSEAYNFGSNDAMQRMYAAERNVQKFDVPGGSSKGASLQTKIVKVPINPYVDSTGQVRDAGDSYVTLHTVQ